MAGCSTMRPVEHPVKYQHTTGNLADLYVELDGIWILIENNIGNYSLCQSPNGQFLAITEFRGCYDIRIKIYDTFSRRLFDITEGIRKCTPALSSRPLFTGIRFTSNTALECGMRFLPNTNEERPIVESLNRTIFTVDVEDLIAEYV